MKGPIVCLNESVNYVDSFVHIPNVFSPVPNKYISEQELREQGKQKKHTPGTAEWVYQRLEDSPQRAVGILLTWIHPKRVREVNEELVQKIRGLTNEVAIEVLHSLTELKQYIRGRRTSQ